jgi:hypothetical protein
MVFAEGRSPADERPRSARTKPSGKVIPFPIRAAADTERPAQPFSERIGNLEIALLVLNGALALGFIAVAVFIAFEVV